ncbi:hypothetical protein E1264_03790 [Actinomadura sp. KC216]|uniref:RNA ligase family protein n=1 Tax=Actinomadura sp. KC216 TaxID=2530370 RepID=UPI00104F20BF|nr:RNA ligase family protein [Actinomadura sp. KC216]TDB90937.1 hypothetical protein E1264_03790 [Actinomadura sp. KC216]
MAVLEFKAWPKTPRLMKPMVVTEKIDGTNGCVVISRQQGWASPSHNFVTVPIENTADAYLVGAQSRKRMLPMGPRGMDDLSWQKEDNSGFARWVRENATELAETLGEGYHYGEWYGQKIQRGYGLSGRRFALFNVSRYADVVNDPTKDPIPGLETVPVLYEGEFDTRMVKYVYDDLMTNGSRAVPGYMNPEGVIVFHTASQQVYKYLGPDDRPKSVLQLQALPDGSALAEAA